MIKRLNHNIKSILQRGGVLSGIKLVNKVIISHINNMKLFVWLISLY